MQSLLRHKDLRQLKAELELKLTGELSNKRQEKLSVRWLIKSMFAVFLPKIT